MTRAPPLVLIGREASRALGASDSGARVVAPSDLAALRLEGGEAVAVEYDLLAPEARRVALEWLSTAGRGRPLLVLWAGEGRRQLSELLHLRPDAHVLCGDGLERTTDVSVTLEKLLTGELFGLQRYLAGPLQLDTWRLSASSERGVVREAIEARATEWGYTPRVQAKLSTLVEELVTNALYDAPRDAAGLAVHAHLGREQSVRLPAGHQIEVTLGHDDARVGVSTRDPYGSLSGARLAERFAAYLLDRPRQPSKAPGGAGLGLFQTFDLVSSFVANIAPGTATEVIGLIDLRGAAHQSALRGRSFGVFQG